MIINNTPLFKLLIIILISIFNLNLFSQFHPDSLIHTEIQGNDTDPFIVGDGNAKKNQVFYNPTSQLRNTLLLHLVGSIDNPNSTIQYPTMAANNGFHCINLMYKNLTSGQAACGDITDTDCHLNYRKEIIEGINYSPEVNVNASNSINNRLLKLLIYQHDNNPSQNWDQYYSGSTILWNKIIVSGHSQGGGHAAVIAMTLPIQRVLMFASPNDYVDTLNIGATWTTLPHLVADSNYYGFNALHDEVVDFWKQYDHCIALGMNFNGDTVNVDYTSAPFNNSRQLYTEQIVVSPNPLHLTHDITVRDAETPVDAFGTPVFECAWKYMLGIDCETIPTGISSVNNKVKIYPNPANDKISITFQNSSQLPTSFQVYSSTGQLILENNNISQSSTEINIGKLIAGCYYVVLKFENEIVGREKFVIQH